MSSKAPHPLLRYIDSQIIEAQQNGLNGDELAAIFEIINYQIMCEQEVLELDSPLIALFKNERDILKKYVRT